MVDIAERPAAELAAPGGKAQGAVDAIRDAGITFLLALALLGSLVGLRTDSAAGGLEITVHFAKAAGHGGRRWRASAFCSTSWSGGPWTAAGRLRRSPGLSRKLRTPAIAAALGAGLLLYAWGGTRTAIIEWASRQSWLAGITRRSF